MFGRFFPEAGDPEPVVSRTSEEVCFFMPLGATPFVVGDDGHEAATVSDRFPPHWAVEVIATSVIDAAETFALKSPPHGDDFSRSEGHGRLVGPADKLGVCGAVRKPCFIRLFGGVEGVAHNLISLGIGWRGLFSPIN